MAKAPELSLPPGQWLDTAPARLADQLRFLLEADRLKHIVRANRTGDGSRHENSAEHSWHIALFATILSEWSAEPVDNFRVVQMLLLHDLVEIECGDTPLYAAGDGTEQAALEKLAADKIFGLLPDDQAGSLRALWDEFEAAESNDARFAKALDRLQPILLNHVGRGGTWSDYDVNEQMVRDKTSRIAAGSPPLWQLAEQVFADAVSNGWLKPRPDA